MVDTTHVYPYGCGGMLVAEYDEEEGNVDDNGCHGQYKVMGINVSIVVYHSLLQMIYFCLSSLQ